MKIIWSLCLFVCTIVCLWFIIQSIQIYAAFSTFVTTSIVDDIPASFPAVSFCNMKLVNSSTPLGASFIKLSTINNTNASLHTWFTLENNVLIQFLNDASLNDSTRKSAGFLIDDMLVSCSFNAITCNSSDFSYFFHQNYGNCYTFNARNDNNQVKTSNFDGSVNGLILELFIGNPSVNTKNQNHDGVVISIHNQTQEPFYQGPIIPVAANAESYLSVKRNFRTKLEPPYGNCMNDTSSSLFYEYIVNKINRSYNQELCLKICAQYQLIQTCGCQVTNFIFYKNSSAGYCNTTKLTFLYNFRNNSS